MWKASPIFLLIICLEIFLNNYHKKQFYSWKETAANFYLSILNGGLDLLIRGAYFILLTWVYQHHLFTISNSILYWVVLAVSMDFMFYWLHRLEHYCRLFWAVHVTHHSCEKMNVTVGFRSSVFQPLYRFLFFIPLAFTAFQPIDILFLYSLTQFWAIFVHTEFIKKLGLMEYIFVTPSHHRVHHASNALYLDRNMGMFLIVWDRLFGTFQEERAANDYEPIRYGLTKPLEKQGPVNLVFHEWVSIAEDLKRHDLDWKTKLKYLFKPPGWSHDGSRHTSEEIREIERVS